MMGMQIVSHVGSLTGMPIDLNLSVPNLVTRGAPPKPWLSVIMPTHNGEAWIEFALQSLSDHGGAGIEVLVLDSSASDLTLAAVAKFAEQLDIRVIDPGDHVMWHAKTNLGVKEARADHICWLHQDDLWLPGRGAALRQWITKDPRAVLHLSNSRIFNSAGRNVGPWNCPFKHEGALDAHELLERLLVQCFVATPAPVYRRDAFQAVGGLDEELWYTADWDLWLKLQSVGRAWFHPQVTAGFRIHDGSLTVSGSRNSDDFRNQLRIVQERHLPRLKIKTHAVSRASEASLQLNTALAAASVGNWKEFRLALAALIVLRPGEWVRFLRDTRLVERVMPRLRARMLGAL